MLEIKWLELHARTAYLDEHFAEKDQHTPLRQIYIQRTTHFQDPLKDPCKIEKWKWSEQSEKF